MDDHDAEARTNSPITACGLTDYDSEDMVPTPDGLLCHMAWISVSACRLRVVSLIMRWLTLTRNLDLFLSCSTDLRSGLEEQVVKEEIVPEVSLLSIAQ